MTEVRARTVLWILTFVGFAVNYMIRINLNITIVEMVDLRAHTTEVTPTPTALPMLSDGNLAVNQTFAVDQQNASLADRQTLVGNFSSDFLQTTPPSAVHSDNRFQWNEYEQGLVLGSFYWAHWITQIPGGLLAKKYGTKLVFGLSNAIGCWLCFLIPMASYFDYRALIWLRVMQGLVTGLSWPAMHVMTASWIPPNERSKFVTAYLGSSVGIAVFYPLFGYVMHWSSWEWVYHICGILGSVWWICWLIFVYNTPAEHPRINQQEVRFIEKALGSSVLGTTKDKVATPWRHILLSRPVWMNVIAQWGGIWGLFTLMTQAPTYFKVVHNWNIRATGLLSGLPHLMRMLFAYAFSMFADSILRGNKMSRTNLRKVATAVCCIVHGVMVVCLAYFGHNSTAAIVFLTLATMFHGAVSSGPLASIVDIAPNYAGIVLGISGMVGVLPGFISPYIVGLLTLGNHTYEAWKNVFLISAAMLIGCGLIFVLFADSTLQKWNTYPLPATTTDRALDLEALKKAKIAEAEDEDGNRKNLKESES